MKKIKVCFVGTYAWALFEPNSKTPFGGAEIQLYQLAKEIAKDKRFEVSFIVGDFGQKSPLLYYDGIKVYKGFIPPEYEISKLKQISIERTLKPVLKLGQVLHQVYADIYIQYSATWVTGIIAFFCILFRKKFLYMVAHDMDLSGEYVRKNSLRGKVFEWGLKNAHQIVAQNGEQIKLLDERYHKKAILMKLVYFIEAITLGGKKYILWMARGESWKRPGLFFQLAQQFPRENFIMVCQPAIYYGPLFKEIKRTAQQIPNLKFINYVPFSETDRYFREAKVLVNTSDYEGFPNTFIQASYS